MKTFRLKKLKWEKDETFWGSAQYTVYTSIANFQIERITKDGFEITGEEETGWRLSDDTDPHFTTYTMHKTLKEAKDAANQIVLRLVLDVMEEETA